MTAQAVIAAGRVSALCRYPVKSMQGEQLPELQLTGRGVDGDRVLALLDRAGGLVASAHHPAKWGRLLHCRARTASGREVWVTLPGGRELPAGAELERELATLLGHDVGLISSAPTGGAYEIIHPDVPGPPHHLGRARRADRARRRQRPPTLAQHGVTDGKQALRTLARDNRVPIGPGTWACLGLYARVSTPGAVRVSAPFTVTRG